MLKTFTDALKFGNTYCGIEHSGCAGKEKIHGCLLKKVKSEIILDRRLDINSIEELSDILSKGQHISLVINNDQVLSKLVEFDDKKSLEQTVLENYPNIDLEKFYYELTRFKDKQLVCICRKDYVDGLIEQYLKYNLFVIDFSLGYAPLESLLPFLNNPDLAHSNVRRSVSDHSFEALLTILSEVKTLEINGLEMSSDLMLCFAASMTTILGSNPQSKSKKELTGVYLQHRAFIKGAKAGLIAVFGILLINFLIFNHNYRNVQNLQQTIESNRFNTDLLVSMQQELKANKIRYENIMHSGNSKSSFYLNTIIAELPDQLTLSKYVFQPLSEKIKSDKPILVQSGTILINGNSTNKKAISDFIGSLEQQNWISIVQVSQYRDISNDESEFEIRINLGYEN